MTDSTQEQGTPAASASPNPLVGLLASLKFALTILVLIAAACVVGTLLPQGAQVAKYLAQHPDAQGRMRVFETLGLTHVFYASWFIGLLGLLSASLAVCTFRRYQALRTASAARRWRVLGSLVTHISLLLVLAGAVLRALLGEQGIIEFHEGETVSRFRGHQGVVELPFAVHLVKFELEYHSAKKPAVAMPESPDVLVVTWPGHDLTNTLPVRTDGFYTLLGPGAQKSNAHQVAITRYEPDFMVDTATHSVTSRTTQPNNPAVLVSVRRGGVTNEQWVFARYPEFQSHADSSTGPFPFELRFLSDKQPRPQGMGDIKSFTSTVRIQKGKETVLERQVRVNSPLSYGGYTLYQSGYDPADPSWTSLQIVKDPGVPLVYTGFTLMMVGLVIVFWIHPLMESSRRKSGGPV